MGDLHRKLYATLVGRVEDIMQYINSEMVLKETYDWDHMREILLKLQGALQECEDIYIDEAED